MNSQLNEIYVLNHELGTLANQRLERSCHDDALASSQLRHQGALQVPCRCTLVFSRILLPLLEDLLLEKHNYIEVIMNVLSMRGYRRCRAWYICFEKLVPSPLVAR